VAIILDRDPKLYCGPEFLALSKTAAKFKANAADRVTPDSAIQVTVHRTRASV
jgi:hypothetical protein